MSSNKITINVPVGVDYEINLVKSVAAPVIEQKEAKQKKKRNRSGSIIVDKDAANFLIHGGFMDQMRGITNNSNNSTKNVYYFAKTDAVVKAYEQYNIGLEQLKASTAVELPPAEDFAELESLLETE